MRSAALVILLALPAGAAPVEPLPYAKTPKQAVEIARTRGKLIFITVCIDSDAENRAAVQNVLHDKAWQKVARDFVLIYANKDRDHGAVVVKLADGKREQRDADVPELTQDQVRHFANSYAAAFYPEESEGIYKTPIHFIVDANEELVDAIFNGDWKGGFNHVPAKTVIERMKKALAKHGKGISEQEYAQLQKNLLDANTARSRKNLELEIKLLQRVTALPKNLVDVQRAQGRLGEIDALGKAALTDAEALVKRFLWEDALDSIERIEQSYQGLPSALLAATRRKELLKDKEVARVIKARDLYETGKKLLDNGKPELASRKFDECVRTGKDTKYADLAAEELKKLGG